ncbi:MAG: 3'-5' exoribonuclease YhaM family protein [Lachnospiraceae bacterium]|jgi:3'-5' exoribonuclease
MKKIQEFQEGDRISQVLLCQRKTEATTKSGKNYYSLVLQDSSGTIDGKVWELTNAIEDFDQADFIFVDGQVIVYNGQNQLNISRIRRAQENEYDQGDFFPKSERDPKEMLAEIQNLVSSVKEPHLNALLASFFMKDTGFIESFLSHSAAKSIHHGFIGGLAEHTLGVANLCDSLASLYPFLNRDLLITAALFHDIGKVRELSLFPSNDYTDEGQLIGHIIIGYQMVSERMKTIPDFPQKLGDELLHCILAHHGELEYGSPKKPAIPEALALSLADLTDARMETIKEATAAAQPGEWVGYSRALESNVKRTE